MPRGTSSSALLRACRLGQQLIVAWAGEELARQVPDRARALEALQLLTETSFQYIDAVSEDVMGAYQDERERWVVGVATAPVAPEVPRVTLTFPVLGSCREMLFEVAGPDKHAILTRVLAGENLPANRAHAAGETVWLVDKSALPEEAGGQ